LVTSSLLPYKNEIVKSISKIWLDKNLSSCYHKDTHLTKISYIKCVLNQYFIDACIEESVDHGPMIFLFYQLPFLFSVSPINFTFLNPDPPYAHVSFLFYKYHALKTKYTNVELSTNTYYPSKFCWEFIIHEWIYWYFKLLMK
jgi:hypothetical protein